MKIAFIGLGNMGGPMALNIAKAGYDINVFDLDKSKAEPILAAGGVWSTSPAEVVVDADVVMTSLPGPKQLQSIALDEGNILDAMKQGSIWIDLSTNNLEVEREIRAAAEAKGIATLDAPISGGTEGAAAGSLAIYVGGKAETYEKVKDILDVIGGDVKHLGDHGAGYVAKISQVMLCYLHSVALSEALMLGVKGGVDPEIMLGIVQKSTGRSYVADRYGPPILEGSYDPGFALGLAHKDMKLTLELAKSTGTTLPMCEQVEDIYSRAVGKYGFDQNHLMAVKLLEEQNDQLLRGK
ncbi:NAD(P)-dependent oxidoreductase [Curvivirga aplysinae]|uniref:NAD(P)-dependent oxidoreductase n=1 Tax=Curvivirga aplysinae TaxID=2529852 RepID=UPI0012BCCAF9|nr:NAD(P)-dependent oxidoreductase [Curvivirga aplysinae]MTI09854.1 NAD(P)-dependent oxidoreductase [Curvivirga aplysinae]